MSNTQTKWIALLISIVVSLCFLAALVEFRSEMELMRRSQTDLQKQIEKLQLENTELSEQLKKSHSVSENTIKKLSEVQSLQRKQGLDLDDLKTKKNKKH
jgi:uncharacterized membrane-anchored protein YhcB (DUF1043 family)